MRGWKALVGASLIGALIGMGGVAPQQAAAQDPELKPVDRFASCVTGGGQGNVLMLFDMSGSLKDTDPNAGRVTAANATVTKLAESIGGIPGAKVDMAVAGFASTFDESLGWTPLNPESASTITSNMDTYATKNTGVDTDYWTAMDGVRKQFSARNQGQANPCNLLLWFSDGEFALNKRPGASQMERWGGPKAWVPDNPLRTSADVKAAVAAGENDLCRSGGVADQLRSLNIITVGIGLAVDAPPESFNLMKGISTGEGTCGKLTKPVPGQFIMAGDVDELIYNFITALEQGSGSENPLCVESECAEGTRTFVLDGSIGAVSATAKSPVDATRIYLKTRSGDSVEFTQGKGTKDLDGADLAWEWVTPKVLTFTLTRKNPDNWAGPWGIVFVADKKTDELAKSSITLKGDAIPALSNRDDLALRVGAEPVGLKFDIVDHAGSVIAPDTLSDQTTMDVKLINAGKTTTLAEGRTKADLQDPVPLEQTDLAPGIAEVIVTLDVTTQSWEEGGKTIPGTKLEPRHVSIPLNVLPPANFPSIQDRVSFGETDKADPVTVQVPVEGEGCAYLAGETTFSGYPEGLEQAKLTSPATSRDSCAAGKLELTLDPGGLGNGSFTGSTKVFLAPTDGSVNPVQVDLAFDLSQNRPASQPVLWTTLIGVILLGIAIPIAILYLVKALTSKVPGTAVAAGSASGPVDDAHAFTDNGVPLATTQLVVTNLTNNRREVNVAGKTLRAKMGAALTEPGYVVVDTPGPSAGGRTALQSVGGNAKLPLAVQGNWMVALDPQNPVSGPVEVTVFTAPGSPGFAELLDDVRSNIRTAVAKLRQGLPPDSGGQQADPWSGGGGAGPSGGADPWASPQQPQADPWATPSQQQPPLQRPQPPQPQAQPPQNDPWANPPSQPPRPTTW